MTAGANPITLAQLLPAQDLNAELAALCVTGIQSDSRKIQRGDAFLAFPGALVDGRDYIAAAVSQGAAVVLAEADGLQVTTAQAGVPVIPVRQLGSQAGRLAAIFYQQPSRDLFVTAVTGTNGKTSVTHLVARSLDALGHRAAVIGTLGNGPVHALSDAVNTTPGPIELQALLAALRDQHMRVVAMEASSHGLQLGRMNGTAIAVAVVTNISRDHLDFHGTLEAYQMAKARLVSWPGLRWLVLNRDDAIVSSLRQRAEPQVKVLDFSLLDPAAALFAEQVRYTLQGVSLVVCFQEHRTVLTSQLLGKFNVYNLLAALAVLLCYGIALEQAVRSLAQCRPVAGRMEVVNAAESAPAPLIVIDYAHTPDALEQVLHALRPHCRGQLWCVFGCGGDRDVGKRPEMGAIAARLADKLVLSSDNPRSESAQKIVADIEQGIAMGTSYCVELDRAVAITRAIHGAAVDDVVLIAGKGHERYQEIAGRRLPFSDLAVSQQALMSRCA